MNRVGACRRGGEPACRADCLVGIPAPLLLGRPSVRLCEMGVSGKGRHLTHRAVEITDMPLEHHPACGCPCRPPATLCQDKQARTDGHPRPQQGTDLLRTLVMACGPFMWTLGSSSGRYLGRPGMAHTTRPQSAHSTTVFRGGSPGPAVVTNMVWLWQVGRNRQLALYA